MIFKFQKVRIGCVKHSAGRRPESHSIQRGVGVRWGQAGDLWSDLRIGRGEIILDSRQDM